MKTRELDQSTLNDIIHRVVDVTQREKIILFGSAARIRTGRHSDVDLLIKPALREGKVVSEAA